MSVHDLVLHDHNEFKALCGCGNMYDGVNCLECGYFNEASVLPDNILAEMHFANQRQNLAVAVSSIMDMKGKKEGTLEINISDPWHPQIVYIDYKLETLDSMRQLSDEDEIINTINFEFRKGTSNYSISVVKESDINIEDEIRKAFYGNQ